MPTARASIQIDVPPEEVFRFVSDPVRIPEYVKIVLDVFDVSDGRVGVGTTLKEHSKPGPFVSVTNWEIVEYDRPNRQVWLGSQKDMEMTFTKLISPHPAGSTYEQWMDYRFLPKFRPLGRLLEVLFLQRAMQRHFESAVAGIKRIVEAEHAARIEQS
jgi:uncharacterized protein YndB with AHSA1/START domain